MYVMYGGWCVGDHIIGWVVDVAPAAAVLFAVKMQAIKTSCVAVISIRDAICILTTTRARKSWRVVMDNNNPNIHDFE
jgi:hypothetical protein